MAMGRLLLSVVLVMAAAAAGASAFGVGRSLRRGSLRPSAEDCRYYQYHDPSFLAPFRLGTAAAIRLGNTNSCIAGYNMTGHYYQFCIPSWVAFTPNGTLSGEAAMNHAALSPRSAVSAFKRLLGQRLEGEVVKRAMKLAPHKITQHQGWGGVCIHFNDEQERKFSVDDLAGILMSELKRTAEAHVGHEIHRAIVTVPAELAPRDRRDVRSAGHVCAGFEAVKVLDEPIAAAAAYGHHTKQGDGKAVLVFHLGGRTTAATLFKFIDGTTPLIDASSDLFLGGDDFTRRVVDYLVELIKERHHRDIRGDRVALLKLTAACERAKKALSAAGDLQEEALVEVESLLDDGASFSAPLTRAKFEELNRDLFDRAVEVVKEVVEGRDGSGSRRVVDEVVVVGGSTRIPKVRQLLRGYFSGSGSGSEPNYNPEGLLEPDEAVVHGAAVISRPEAARYLEDCFEHMYGCGGSTCTTMFYGSPIVFI